MTFVLLLIFVGVFVAVVVSVTSGNATVDEKFSEQLEWIEPAFEVDVSYAELSSERVEQIRQLVDRVGVVQTTERRRDHQGRSTDVLVWEVYLLDVNGEFHQVETTAFEERAAEIALDVAAMFDVPLDDPEYVTAGRG